MDRYCIVDNLWEESIKIIKEKISPQNFETWIRPLKVVSLEGNHASLSVPNKFFKDWLTENYRDVISDAVSSSAGKDYAIDFVILQESEKNSRSAHPARKKKIIEQIPQEKIRPKIHPTLNPNYSFERFVVGSSNQFAHAAAVAVAEQPAKNYNPLFIYGGVGLGKTHLLNAIGLLSMSIYPDMNVVYVSAEEFMNELILSIRYDKMPQFREKFRNIDCLLMDDIQFIAGKERTQEEFFHTFNTLHDSGKQIVVTSDKFPKDIPNLEGRLRSRFEWGLIADIQPPEIETKIAILEKKAQENNIHIPTNVAYYISSHAESNIRELEGFLVRIAAYSSVTGRNIDLDLVKEVLKDIIKHRESDEISFEEILKAVAARYNLKIADIKSQSKNKNIAMARQVTMYMARKLTGSSFPDIGEKIGGRDHSTVIYANNKIRKLLETDSRLKATLQEIEDQLLKKN
ncbi:chromosomal replication initiator protein [Syntrophus aciditrophicus SB]|uniref:Chromosomal replication initiator protein DnaA n=1 Tax=Syntrophus aciditrophicus (strain SB) TaxID=56780 RepID=Q2LYA3_SYNAS|nr:chromosomal replication initiator protein [Syntrophus aciditrophicus SB]